MSAHGVYGMSKHDGFYLRQYVAVIIDVLGQQSKLKGWERLPADGSLPVDLIKAVKDTVGTIVRCQRLFETVYSSAKSFGAAENEVQLTAEQSASFAKCSEAKITCQQFSDTFVMYSPLENTSGEYSAFQVVQMLGACAAAMLSMLTDGIPLRGGIAVGAGTEIAEGNFYGPVLAEAHRLESKCAQSPRIVVSRDVIAYLQHLRCAPEQTDVDRMMARLACQCDALLCRDKDGFWIVDYMGQAMRDWLKPNPEIPIGVKRAYAFVCSEQDRVRELGDNKLLPRYTVLRQYIESRLPLWIK